VFSEVRSQRSEHNMWGVCIKIRSLLEPARPGYALLVTLIPCLSCGSKVHSPSESNRMLNGSAVVAIGVDRRSVGCDDGARCRDPASHNPKVKYSPSTSDLGSCLAAYRLIRSYLLWLRCLVKVDIVMRDAPGRGDPPVDRTGKVVTWPYG
jgi:hypothetical protein